MKAIRLIMLIMVVLPKSRVPGSDVTVTSMSHRGTAVKGQELFTLPPLAVVLFFFHLGLGDNILLNIPRHDIVVAEFHRVTPLATSHA